MKDLIDQQLIDFIDQLADCSGETIRPYFRGDHNKVEKEDGTPVTEADTKAEQVLRDKIRSVCQESGIIGEEQGEDNVGNHDAVWYLDPIDGTVSFTAGRPIFTTLIAFTYKGEPLVGCIDQPINGERWLGYKEMTTFNGEPMVTSDCQTIEAAKICTTGPNYFTDEQNKAFLAVSRQAAHTIYGGDAYNYGLLASGHVDAIIEAGLKLHDMMALIPVIQGAGGVVTCWRGGDPTVCEEGSIIAAATPELHQEIIGQLT